MACGAVNVGHLLEVVRLPSQRALVGLHEALAMVRRLTFDASAAGEACAAADLDELHPILQPGPGDDRWVVPGPARHVPDNARRRGLVLVGQ